MVMKNDYLPGGIDDSTYVLPFGEGLTNDMAEARNPAGKMSYRFIKEKSGWYSADTSTNLYYMVVYNRMQVCACVYTCGQNGFKFSMLWKRYSKKIFYKNLNFVSVRVNTRPTL